MSDVAQHRLELVGEVKRIHRLLSDARPTDLDKPTPCAGWSVLDVARHVEVTPRAVAAGIDAHLQGKRPPATEPMSPDADLAQVLAALIGGADALDASLGRLEDKALDGALPGPVGPMPGRFVLDLALTELTLHRCDIELGLGLTPDIADGAGGRLLDVLQAWLLATAPAHAAPKGAWCHELRGSARSWFFSFDGSRWSDHPCHTGEVIAVESTAQAILTIAGRKSAEDPPMAALKTYLPGP